MDHSINKQNLSIYKGHAIINENLKKKKKSKIFFSFKFFSININSVLFGIGLWEKLF